jgi:hypothetical protein
MILNVRPVGTSLSSSFISTLAQRLTAAIVELRCGNNSKPLQHTSKAMAGQGRSNAKASFNCIH